MNISWKNMRCLNPPRIYIYTEDIIPGKFSNFSHTQNSSLGERGIKDKGYRDCRG